MKKKKTKKTKKSTGGKVNILMIIVSAIGAFISWGLCYPIYGGLSDEGNGPITIGVVSMCFLLMVGLIVWGASCIFKFFSADIITGKKRKFRILIYLLIAAIICCLLMMGLDFLYELDFSTKVLSGGKASTFIFLVDDSDSTLVSDRDYLRYDAITSILEQKPNSNEFAVYSFGTDVSMVLPMQEVGDGIPQLAPVQDGVTEMAHALEKIMSDYKNGVWTGHGGKMVILITDGAATDISSYSDIDPILSEYAREHIAISTVGLGNVDDVILDRISSMTGGTSIGISSASDMASAVEQAVVNTRVNSSDLFSARWDYPYSWLRGIMRIAFITIFGVFFGLVMALCYGNKNSLRIIVISSIIKSVVAGLVLELFIEACTIDPLLPTTIAAVLIGTLIPLHPETHTYTLDDGMFDNDDPFSTTTGRIEIF